MIYMLQDNLLDLKMHAYQISGGKWLCRKSSSEMRTWIVARLVARKVQGEEVLKAKTLKYFYCHHCTPDALPPPASQPIIETDLVYIEAA